MQKSDFEAQVGKIENTSDDTTSGLMRRFDLQDALDEALAKAEKTDRNDLDAYFAAVDRVTNLIAEIEAIDVGDGGTEQKPDPERDADIKKLDEMISGKFDFFTNVSPTGEYLKDVYAKYTKREDSEMVSKIEAASDARLAAAKARLEKLVA